MSEIRTVLRARRERRAPLRGIEADMLMLSLGALAVMWLAVVVIVVGLCVGVARTDRRAPLA